RRVGLRGAQHRRRRARAGAARRDPAAPAGVRVRRRAGMTLRALVVAVVALLPAGCVGTTSTTAVATTTPHGGAEQIPMSVVKPDGAGPCPAVVIAHDCSGLGPRSSGAPDRWARELVSRGYVVLTFDSFSTRGFPDCVCTNASPKRNDVSPAQRAFDAYAALAYARPLPYVD